MSLPSGWRSALLGELVSLQTGPFGSSLHQADYLPGGTPLVNPMHIVAGRIRPNAEHAVSIDTLDRLSAFRLREGDVVIGRRGEMGRCAVVTKREAGWLCGTGSMVIRCCGALLPAYLQGCLTTSEAVDFLGQESVGSTMANLNQKILLSLPIILPPVAEQQRIVDALDEIDPELSDAASELVAAKRKLSLYRQSLLKSAVEGTLTAEWRDSLSLETGAELLQRVERRRLKMWRRTGLKQYAAASKSAHDDPFGLPEHWTWVSIDSVVQSSSYGTSVKCETRAFGTPVLRIPNLRSGALTLDDLKHTVEPLALDDNEYLTPGDVLVVRTNGSVSLVGRSACVPRPGLTDRAYFASYLLRLRPVLPRMMGEWIVTWLSSPPARRLIERMAASSAGQHNIGLSALLRLPLPLPPLAEQQAIDRLLRENFAAVEAHELAIDHALKMAAAQRQNIVRAAFSGQLVPQDPNDEPASKLLDRIRAQRAAAPAPPRRGRRSAKQTTAA